MNTLIVLSVFVAACTADAPIGGVSVFQDTVGNYKLNYNFDDASRVEQGFQGGRVQGGYTFRDTDGDHHTINYFVGPDGGYVAQGDIPTPVQDTLAVSEVRAAHLAEDARQRSFLPPLVEDPIVQFIHTPIEFRHVPITSHFVVDNTAEIEAAKAEHFAAHREALARLAEAYQNIN